MRLCACIALQTMIMVAFARVLTVQYFAWWIPYLALLPVPSVEFSRRCRPHVLRAYAWQARSIALWLACFGAWMWCGYWLEFCGAPWAIHALFVAGAAFFLAQCNLVAQLARSLEVTALGKPAAR